MFKMALNRFNTPEYFLCYPSGLFIFPVKVPGDCRPSISQAEARYSLKTRVVDTAEKQLAIAIARQIIRSGKKPGSTMSSTW